MGISRDILAQLEHVLRPHATRIANMVARGVVNLIDDSKKLQLLQVGALANETIDGAEHHQPYGFSSVPLAGAEVVAVFPNGDRAHPLVVAVSDRRYRPTGSEAGSVTLYHYKGGKVTMLANGNIELEPGPGGQVLVTTGGATEALVKKSDFDGHTHAPGTFQAPSGGGPVTGISGGAAAAAGTTLLQSE